MGTTRAEGEAEREVPGGGVLPLEQQCRVKGTEGEAERIRVGHPDPEGDAGAPGRMVERGPYQAQLRGLIRLIEARRLNELPERGDRGAARHQKRRAQQHQRCDGARCEGPVAGRLQPS